MRLEIVTGCYTPLHPATGGYGSGDGNAEQGQRVSRGGNCLACGEDVKEKIFSRERVLFGVRRGFVSILDSSGVDNDFI